MSFVTSAPRREAQANFQFQSLKGIHVVCDEMARLTKLRADKFQSLKGIHVVCDWTVYWGEIYGDPFQSLKGIHVVCDPRYSIHPKYR